MIVVIETGNNVASVEGTVNNVVVEPSVDVEVEDSVVVLMRPKSKSFRFIFLLILFYYVKYTDIGNFIDYLEFIYYLIN
jgi:hypothetical protein